MYSIRVFCEELIKEIIDNVYVSNDKKEEFTKQLHDYIIETEKGDEKENKVHVFTSYGNLQSKNKKYTYVASYISAITTGIASITVALATFMFSGEEKIKTNNTDISTIIAVLTILISAFGIAILINYFIKKNKRKK